MLQKVLLIASSLLWWTVTSQLTARGQTFPDGAWGFSRTVTSSEQTITTTITEQQFSNRNGFAIAGENVAVSNPDPVVSPNASFVIVNSEQQFNLGIDQFTPVPDFIDSVKVTNQESVTETHSRTFSVFQ
jgi:hypothetical protein